MPQLLLTLIMFEIGTKLAIFGQKNIWQPSGMWFLSSQCHRFLFPTNSSMKCFERTCCRDKLCPLKTWGYLWFKLNQRYLHWINGILIQAPISILHCWSVSKAVKHVQEISNKLHCYTFCWQMYFYLWCICMLTIVSLLYL